MADQEQAGAGSQDPATRIIKELESIRSDVSTLAGEVQALWGELDRRTTVAPGELFVGQRIEALHADVRYLLYLLRPAVETPEDTDGDDRQGEDNDG